jgi:hypothetical protein
MLLVLRFAKLALIDVAVGEGMSVSTTIHTRQRLNIGSDPT